MSISQTEAWEAIIQGPEPEPNRSEDTGYQDTELIFRADPPKKLLPKIAAVRKGNERVLIVCTNVEHDALARDNPLISGSRIIRIYELCIEHKLAGAWLTYSTDAICFWKDFFHEQMFLDK